MDEKYKAFRSERYQGYITNTQMKLLPSEYLRRQCWITGEANEPTFSHMAQLVGADRLAWGSDYPHGEGHADPLGSLKKTIGELSREYQAMILGGNMVGEYGLN